jgi:acyl carrier protein
MTVVRADEVKAFVASTLADALKENNVPADALPETLDLMKKGIIDSIGLIMLISAIEEHFDLDEVDFEYMDTEELTIIGPLCAYIAERAKRKGA